MRRTLRIILVFSALLQAQACQARLKPDSFDLLAGYGRANLKFQPEIYRVAPVYASAGYDIISSAGRLFQFCVEPFYSYASTPSHGFETGVDAALKVGLLPDQPMVLPYMKAGIGGIYVSEETAAQHNGLNFNEYVGIGSLFFTGSPVRLVVEFRYRHVSNARLALPNAGIDTFLLLGGLSVSF